MSYKRKSREIRLQDDESSPERDAKRTSTKVSDLMENPLTPSNWNLFEPELQDRMMDFGRHGEAILEDGIPVPKPVKPKEPEVTKTIWVKVDGQRVSKEVETPEKDFERYREDLRRYETALTKWSDESGKVFSFLRKNTGTELKETLRLNHQKELAVLRKNHDNAGLLKLMQAASSDLVKVGATTLMKEYQAVKQGDRTTAAYALDVEARVEQLRGIGEVITDPRQTTFFKLNANQERYYTLFVNIFPVMEDHPDYPKYETVKKRMMLYDTEIKLKDQHTTGSSGRRPKQSDPDRRGDGGSVAAFVVSQDQLKQNRCKQCASADMDPDDWKRVSHFCNNCGEGKHHRSECKYRAAQCAFCKKDGHLHQYCFSANAALKDERRNASANSTLKAMDKKTQQRGGKGKQQRGGDSGRDRERRGHGSDRRGDDRHSGGREQRERRRSPSPDRHRRGREDSRDRGRRRRSPDRRDDRDRHQRGGRDVKVAKVDRRRQESSRSSSREQHRLRSPRSYSREHDRCRDRSDSRERRDRSDSRECRDRNDSRARRSGSDSRLHGSRSVKVAKLDQTHRIQVGSDAGRSSSQHTKDSSRDYIPSAAHIPMSEDNAASEAEESAEEEPDDNEEFYEEERILSGQYHIDSDVTEAEFVLWLQAYCTRYGNDYKGTKSVPEPRAVHSQYRECIRAWMATIFRMGNSHSVWRYRAADEDYDSDELDEYYQSLEADQNGNIVPTILPENAERYGGDKAAKYSRTFADSSARVYMFRAEQEMRREGDAKYCGKMEEMVLYDSCAGVNIEQYLKYVADRAQRNRNKDINVYGLDSSSPLEVTHTGYHHQVGGFRVVPTAGVTIVSIFQLRKHGHTIQSVDDDSSQTALRITGPSGVAIIVDANSEGHYCSTRAEFLKLVNAPSSAAVYSSFRDTAVVKHKSASDRLQARRQQDGRGPRPDSSNNRGGASSKRLRAEQERI